MNTHVRPSEGEGLSIGERFLHLLRKWTSGLGPNLDPRPNSSRGQGPAMTNSEDEKELKELSDFYEALRTDAREITRDLQGGVAMWREAAGANLAVAGFVIMLMLSTVTFGPVGTEGILLRLAYLAVAIASICFAVKGFEKYSQLRRRYSVLFAKAKKLE